MNHISLIILKIPNWISLQRCTVVLFTSDYKSQFLCGFQINFWEGDERYGADHGLCSHILQIWYFRNWVTTWLLSGGCPPHFFLYEEFLINGKDHISKKSKHVISFPSKFGAILARFEATHISKTSEGGYRTRMEFANIQGPWCRTLISFCETIWRPPPWEQTGCLFRHSEMSLARESATITCIWWRFKTVRGMENLMVSKRWGFRYALIGGWTVSISSKLSISQEGTQTTYDLVVEIFLAFPLFQKNAFFPFSSYFIYTFRLDWSFVRASSCKD